MTLHGLAYGQHAAQVVFEIIQRALDGLTHGFQGRKVNHSFDATKLRLPYFKASIQHGLIPHVAFDQNRLASADFLQPVQHAR